VVAIQVKTTGVGAQFTLGAKNEEATSTDNEWFALVSFKEGQALPVYYFVPRNVDAAWVFTDHRLWLRTPGRRGQPHRDNPRRAIKQAEIEPYRDGWELLHQPTTQVPAHLPPRLRGELESGRIRLPPRHPGLRGLRRTVARSRRGK
jgi:hypothetical protein